MTRPALQGSAGRVFQTDYFEAFFAVLAAFFSLGESNGAFLPSFFVCFSLTMIMSLSGVSLINSSSLALD